MNKNIKKVSKIVWTIFRTFLLVGVGFILLYPVLCMISIAIRPPSEVADPSIIWIPRTLVTDNFIGVWKVMDYPKPLINTLAIGMVSSLIQIITCAVTGYGFARFKFKGRSIFLALLIFTIIVPPQTVSIPTFIQFRELKLLDTSFVFYLPTLLGMGIRSALFIFIYRQFFRGMPKELEDSAYVDGCGAIRTFVSIMLPNATAVVLTVFLFSVVWHWNDYFYASMYMANNPTVATALSTLSANLYKLKSEIIYNSTYMQAGSLITIVPLCVMYLFTQKYFTESIERTGIVG